MNKEICYEIDMNNCISVLTMTSDGTHREALTPLQLERAKEILPDDLYAEVQELWTAEVIQAYKDSLPKEEVPDLEALKGMKLAEINTTCQRVIHAGVEVETSEGLKHFSLQSEDQMNLSGLAAQMEKALLGQASTVDLARGIPYHADGELCRFWSVEDFAKIATTATNYVFYHQAYCNHLREYVRGLEDIETLQAVRYGMELPEELQESMNGLLGGDGVDSRV